MNNFAAPPHELLRRITAPSASQASGRGISEMARRPHTRGPKPTATD
jgi:hypothetical protein